MNVKMNTKNTMKIMMNIKNIFLKNFQRKENMQDTKLRNLSCLDTMNAKMHMKNTIQHKTRKYEDQTRRLIKNNLKIMKNAMHEFSKTFRKLKRCN